MFSLRPATLDDAPVICALINRANRHEGIPQLLTLDELDEHLRGDAVDLIERSMLAVGPDGDVIAHALVLHRLSNVIEHACNLEGDVDPAWRRRGIGTALFDWQVCVSTELLQALGQDGLPRVVRVAAYDYITDQLALAATFGFVAVRYFEELLRRLTDLPARSTVDGLTILAWPDDRDAEILAAKNTAFLDHWGSTPTSAAGWHDQIRGHGGRPELSFVAVDAHDAVVAMLVTGRYEEDDELIGRRDAWIQTLGTLRAWRGRGVGSALIAAALHAYAAAGLTHASIGVDSENPSGAARLYRSLGFELSQRAVTRELQVR